MASGGVYWDPLLKVTLNLNAEITRNPVFTILFSKSTEVLSENGTQSIKNIHYVSVKLLYITLFCCYY